MSRTFTNGSGADVTSTTLAQITAAGRSYEVCDLIVIHTNPTLSGGYLDQTFLLTSYGANVRWNYRGTFVPAQFSRGEVESKIGLESDTLEIDWGPKDTDVLATNVTTSNVTAFGTTLTVMQGFNYGLFDNGIVEVWRCPFPNQANTYGASLLFSGRIGDIQPSRLGVKMTLQSRLELLNIQVPTNIVEPTNILVQYVTGQTPIAAVNPTSVYIPGEATPWDTTINPSFDFGNHGINDPVTVDITAIAGYATGATMRISGSGSVRCSSARPYVGPNGQPPPTDGTTGSSGTFYPTKWISASTIGLGGLCGTFTNTAGQIIGTPFDIGSGANVVIPSGATRLSLGINDDIFTDNVGSFNASVVIQSAAISGITIQTGSTVNKLFTNASSLWAAGTYNGGYIVFTSGKLQGIYRSVESQDIEAGLMAFYIYPDLPFIPANGDALGAYVVLPTDYISAIQIGVGFAGFPFVPSPVNSSMIIA